MAGGNVIEINSKEEWAAKHAEAKNSQKPIIVDFSATWCGPCRVIGPYFEELSTQYPGITFLKVDVDAVEEAGMRFTLDVIVLSGFGYDFEAVNMLKPNRVVEVLPCALEEIQTRMISPLQALSCSQASRKAGACIRDAVKESLRMFPVIAGVPRLTDRAIRLGPYLVPKNTMVYVLFYRMHNSPKLWHKPEAFLPERGWPSWS
ncbi:hypothetical protein WJX81_006079 [Elliptochloris bilobata]|uniref:Thioredoxin domain-containing protein n=1 Tax=Elliptochloris bilobata TaxID=381761 RepID=A0AAW1R1H6_9CHLO